LRKEDSAMHRRRHLLDHLKVQLWWGVFSWSLVRLIVELSLLMRRTRSVFNLVTVIVGIIFVIIVDYVSN